jgi:hypothetical protein
VQLLYTKEKDYDFIQVPGMPYLSAFINKEGWCITTVFQLDKGFLKSLNSPEGIKIRDWRHTEIYGDDTGETARQNVEFVICKIGEHFVEAGKAAIL